MRHAPLVLMYHGVGDVDAKNDVDNLFIPTHAFAEQMSLLKRAGYRIITEAEYLEWLNGSPLAGPSVLLTFDDGYVEVLRNAAPVLANLRMPAVCFVCPELLGGRSTWMNELSWHELMDAGQLAELVDKGFDLGIHSADHCALDLLDPSALDRHTVGAREQLDATLGIRARSFAYPYGSHCAASRQNVSAAGFEAAFAIYETAGRWALPRVDINSVDTPRTFKLKLNAAYPFVRRALSIAPPLRRAAHRVVGLAKR